MNDPLNSLQSAPSSFDTLLSTMRKRMWMILAIVVSLPALVGFVVSKEPKVYEATATIIIDASVPQYLGAGFKDVVEIESNWWSAQEMLQTELKVLRSHSTAAAGSRRSARMQATLYAVR